MLHAIGQFLQDYQTLIVAVAPLLFALIRATKWGHANEQALQKVAEAIEAVDDKALKQDVAAKFHGATAGEKAAIDQAVAVVDPKKTPLTRYEQIVADVASLLLSKQEGK